MDQFMHWSTTQLNDEIINLLSQGDAYKRTCYQNSNNNENADFVICSHAQEGTVGEMTYKSHAINTLKYIATSPALQSINLAYFEIVWR